MEQLKDDSEKEDDNGLLLMGLIYTEKKKATEKSFV